MEESPHVISRKEARKLMFKLGCTGAMNQVINQAFGQRDEAGEKATAPLCGGMMQQGLECGMLWGVALGIGAECYRSSTSLAEAIPRAIDGTRQMIKTFTAETRTPLCSKITGCNQSRATGVARYMLSGGPRRCINLMHGWIPAAIRVSKESLALAPEAGVRISRSCASEVLNKMGASDREQAMVSGFAGGLGLEGGACGALAAAIWFRTLDLTRMGETVMSNPGAKEMLRQFKSQTRGEMLCHKICGQRFLSVDDHSSYLERGACAELIESISHS